MATAKQESKKTSVSYGKKFGLDPNRKKLAAGLENFDIVKIVLTESKKKYQHTGEDGELTKGKISIAQIDIIDADGKTLLFYSPNAPIVEACENILKDEEFGAGENGTLSVPCHIDKVIEGKGEGNKKYLAFQ